MRNFFLTLQIFLISYNGFGQLSWTEVQIPMSDGENLAADVYLPPDWDNGPTILIQTPYWKDLFHIFGLPLGILYNQDEMNYAFVVVDWRGFFGSSSAAYAGAPSRGEDGYDVVEWIAAQEWSNGKIGTWGPSALGRVQYQTAKEQPPHLVCMVPLVASPLYEYGEYYANGAARTEFLEQLDVLGFGTSPVIYANPYYNLLWSFTESQNHYPEEIAVPTLMIGGWYDHNIDVMIRTFNELQTMSPENVQNQHKILMGPWVHGGSGSAIVGAAQQGELEYEGAVGWSDSLAIAFFDYHLREIDNGWNETPAVTYFQMGDDEWRNATSIPITSNPIKLYLKNDFSLSTELSGTDAELDFTYDPSDPSPTIGGPTLRTDLEQGPFDQSELVESRDDILVFSTGVLPDDVEIMGTVKVKIVLQTDVPDTDIAVRLCDVYPDGRSMLVNNGIYRLRFINGFSAADEQFLINGNNYTVEITLPHTALTFKAGHQIRLDISGSNYPMFNRNMNTGGEMYPNGNGDTLVNPVIANNTLMILANDANSCNIELPVIGEFPLKIDEGVFVPFAVFPNPADTHTTITFNNLGKENVEVDIFNSTGKLVKTFFNVTNGTTLDLSELSAGTYSISIVDGDNLYGRSIIIR